MTRWHPCVQVAWYMTGKHLAVLPVFRALPEKLQRLFAARLMPVTLPPGQFICQEGEPADALWILAEGGFIC